MRSLRALTRFLHPETSVLKMLRFDPSGAIHPEYGVTDEQLQSLYPRLLELRQELIEADANGVASHHCPDTALPLGSGFYSLPKAQLEDYRKHRETSPLGRIFKVANSQMDMVDAVVVVGAGGMHAGPHAIMRACCDPYHNELRRGPRGGKPRMYFAGNNFDNDAAQALLSRITAGGYGETAAETRWVMVVNSRRGETLETEASSRQFLTALRTSLKNDATNLLPRFVVPVTGSGRNLNDLATALGCEEIFAVPDATDDRFTVLSPVGLIPAAMLGLDIMKFLEGAVAMNQHFESAAPDKNMVLQFVAINHLLERYQAKAIRVLSVWSESLESVGKWYEELLAGSGGKHGLGATPLTTVNTRDLHSRHQQHLHGRNDKVFHNLIVEKFRTDPLPLGPSCLHHDALDCLAETDLTDIMAAAIHGANESFHEERRPTTDIVLPTIDTHVLGQLFQMLMIATVIECHLSGVDPYGQPGRERYKSKLALHLARG